MPHPVEVAKEPLIINEEITERAEALVKALVRIAYAGAYGSNIETPPTIIRHADGKTFPLDLSSAEQQLSHRQLAVALAAVLPTWGFSSGGATPGPGPTPIEGDPNLVEAECTSDEEVGDVVYALPTPEGYLVARTDPVEESKIPAIGIIESKPTTTSCIVRVGGLLRAVYSSLEAGRTYFVGFNGRLASEPLNPAPGAALFSQEIGVALNANTLLVAPTLSIIHVKG